MRVYIGTAALQIGLGVAIGLLLGWALTRAYFVALLRRIQRRIGAVKTGTLHDGVRVTPTADGKSFTISSANIYSDGLETELRRRKL